MPINKSTAKSILQDIKAKINFFNVNYQYLNSDELIDIHRQETIVDFSKLITSLQNQLEQVLIALGNQDVSLEINQSIN